MIEYYGEIFNTGVNRDLDAANGTLAVITSEPKIRKYNLTTLAETSAGGAAVVASPIGISLCAGATAVIVSSTTAQVDLVNLSDFVRTQITTNAVAASTNTAVSNNPKGQQVAADEVSKIALAVSNDVAQKIQKIDVAAGTVTQITGISGMSATEKLTTIIVKPGGSAFIGGTNLGRVHEFDTSVTVTKTITLPTTPNVGTAPTLRVSGLSMHGDKLMVTTADGACFVYNYAASTVAQRFPIPSSATSSGLIGTALCNSASGAVIFAPNHAKTASDSGIVEYDLVTSSVHDVHTLEIDSTACPASCIDPSTYRSATIVGSTRIRVLQLPSRSSCTVTTRNQDPPGTDVAARIIRIRLPGNGRAYVESDQNVSAGEASITSVKESDYIELAVRDLATDKVDVRSNST